MICATADNQDIQKVTYSERDLQFEPVTGEPGPPGYIRYLIAQGWTLVVEKFEAPDHVFLLTRPSR